MSLEELSLLHNWFWRAKFYFLRGKQNTDLRGGVHLFVACMMLDYIVVSTAIIRDNKTDLVSQAKIQKLAVQTSQSM